MPTVKLYFCILCIILLSWFSDRSSWIVCYSFTCWFYHTSRHLNVMSLRSYWKRGIVNEGDTLTSWDKRQNQGFWPVFSVRTLRPAITMGCTGTKHFFMKKECKALQKKEVMGSAERGKNELQSLFEYVRNKRKRRNSLWWSFRCFDTFSCGHHYSVSARF